MNSLRAADFRRMGRETMQGNFGMIFLVLLIGGAIVGALSFTAIGRSSTDGAIQIMLGFFVFLIFACNTSIDMRFPPYSLHPV